MVAFGASMKKKLTPEAGFRISHKVKFGFLILVAGYLIWSLQPYSQVRLSKDRIEMEPLISAGKSLYLYKRNSTKNYLRGDIIFFSEGNGPTRLAWIAGVEGDSVHLKGNLVTGHGLELSLQGVPELHERNYPPVPLEHVFLVHRDQSLSLRDSLTEGTYPLKNLNIRGKVFFHLPDEEEPISTKAD
jgi:hypothetical protein